jgi:hypothetical protein
VKCGGIIHKTSPKKCNQERWPNLGMHDHHNLSQVEYVQEKCMILIGFFLLSVSKWLVGVRVIGSIVIISRGLSSEYLGRCS